MKTRITIISILCILFFGNIQAQKIIPVSTFNKVIISPHIQTTFVKSDTEFVTIESCTISEDKVNIEVSNGDLRIFLDDAKEITKTEKSTIDGVTMRRPIYKGTVLTVTINYVNFDELSIRGEEIALFKSPIVQDDLQLIIYGESVITFEEVQLSKLKTTIYGESKLEIKSGTIDEQKITAYGESMVNTMGTQNTKTKLTAYGEAKFDLNVSEELKITAYGEATINYKGNPEVNNGITIGNVKIRQVE